jgi:hypothetical protein
MKSLLIEIERFLRWLRDCTPDERRQHDSEISEMTTALVDQLEPLIDRIEREDASEPTDKDDSD